MFRWNLSIFFEGILIVLICWSRRRDHTTGFADPPPPRGKRYDGIRSFNLQDRSLSSPSPLPLLWKRERRSCTRYVRYPKTHLSSPSALGGMLIQSTVSEMGLPVSSSKSSISDLLLEELPTFHSKETSSRVKRGRTRIRSGSRKINRIINFTRQPFAHFN